MLTIHTWHPANDNEFTSRLSSIFASAKVPVHGEEEAYGFHYAPYRIGALYDNWGTERMSPKHKYPSVWHLADFTGPHASDAYSSVFVYRKNNCAQLLVGNSDEIEENLDRILEGKHASLEAGAEADPLRRVWLAVVEAGVASEAQIDELELTVSVTLNSPETMHQRTLFPYVGHHLRISVAEGVTYLHFQSKDLGLSRAAFERRAHSLLPKVLALLSVATNMLVSVVDNPTARRIEGGTVFPMDTDESPFQTRDFIDGFPIRDSDGSLLLPKSILDLIGKMIKEETNQTETDLASAALLFAGGLFNEQFLWGQTRVLGVQPVGDSLTRGFSPAATVALVRAQYLSSIEIATQSLQPAERCSSCGQLKYSIRKRVGDFVEARLPALKDTFKKFYDDRSKFLHAGVLHDEQRMIGPHGVPDMYRGNGLNAVNLGYSHVELKNLREWTSRMLREQCEEMCQSE